MKARYWDSLAPSFDDQVFDPVFEDSKGLISKVIRSHATEYPHMVDIGCGNGRNIHRFAQYFKSIQGIDISSACIKQAQKGPGKLPGVGLKCHDLLLPFPLDKPFKLGICLNVLLDPSYRRRTRLISNILKLIDSDGRLILLVPSLESVLLTVHQHILLNLKEFEDYRGAAAAATPDLGFTAKSLRDGIVNKGGTPTKHFLKEELELVFSGHGWHIHSVEKVEYPWSSEFENAPSSMGEPYPWDWLLIASPQS